MSNANKSFYQQMLKTNICEVVFTKADSSERTMKCSLLDSVFKQFNISESTKTSKPTNDNLINVIDVDLGEWRSFNIDSVKSFKVISATFSNMLANTQWLSAKPRSQYTDLQNVPAVPSIDLLAKYQQSTRNTQFYLDLLRKNICNITFTKADGSIRAMNATLEPTYVQDHNLAPNNSSADIMFDNDTIRVVDTDINEWRTFKISKLLSFKTPLIEQLSTQSVVASSRPIVVRETTLTTVA